MRRSRAILLGSLMLIGLLVGPGAGLAAAAKPAFPSGATGATGWVCSPHGNGGTGPTTTISAAITFSDPSRDGITCYFPNIATAGTVLPSNVEFGGDCYYNAGMGIGVEFRHRIYAVRGNTASLTCWDGFFVCMNAGVKSTTVECSPTVGASSRRSLM